MSWTPPLALDIGALICVNANYVVQAGELRQQKKETTIGELKMAFDFHAHEPPGEERRP